MPPLLSTTVDSLPPPRRKSYPCPCYSPNTTPDPAAQPLPVPRTLSRLPPIPTIDATHSLTHPSEHGRNYPPYHSPPQHTPASPSPSTCAGVSNTTPPHHRRKLHSRMQPLTRATILHSKKRHVPSDTPCTTAATNQTAPTPP